VLAWRVAETFAPVNSVAVLLEATRGAGDATTAPLVLADAGVENVNTQVDALIEAGVLRRLLAFTELKFSNSTIEAWWRSLKHQWLFLHSLDSPATIRRLVAFYVHEHNHVLPHSAFRGQTPDEMYVGTGRRGTGGACVTRGHRTPSTHEGESIGVLHGVPLTQCRIAPALDRLPTRRRARVRAPYRPRLHSARCAPTGGSVSGIRLSIQCMLLARLERRELARPDPEGP
jgi:hypothetical protein